jgi:predicted HD phosphohydrolase
VPEGFTSVDELFEALRASRDADDEGGLPILDHSLQCAARLRVARPDDVGLQVAGLVHDLGWLERSADGWTLRLDAAHDVDGRALVAGLLGPRVASLVGGHVAAKRYLLATDPRYRAGLSARSETTLAFQGGVMTPAEAERFAASPDLDDLVALRRADDAAKVRGKDVPGLETWRGTVESVVAG